MKTKQLFVIIAASIICASCAGIDKKDQQRYTFSRTFEHGTNTEPRGGTTQGTEVELMTRPSDSWKSLQRQGLSDLERDRLAILAMAGDYRVTFNFLETVSFPQQYEMDRPYQSWATERIYVLEDKVDFISLQHILVMFFVKDGEITGPLVVKHWRQDWKYETESYHTYRGNGLWKIHETTKNERKGAWVQELFNVDDSPRYASMGRWEHTDDFSRWTGNETYRPLPRREYSVRSDYDVIEGINTNIIIPTGWIHEQLNMKVSLQNNDKNYISREIGLNRYEWIVDFDFSAADEYWEKNSEYWKAVRRVWESIMESNRSFVFNRNYKEESLIEKQFGFVDEYDGDMTDEKLIQKARNLIEPHISDKNTTNTNKNY